MEREPCPHRIIDDLGGAFAMGALGGGVWHYFRGLRMSPKGERFMGSIASVKARAPVLGGNFAAWGGLFSTFDCGFAHVRKKEDPWNAIASGFVTGGLLAARGGWKVATRSAIFGGIILGMIEGMGILITRVSAPLTAPQPMLTSTPEPLPAPDHPA